jgi:hypothetical protein
VTFAPSSGTPAEQLWREGSEHGALACGFDGEGPRIVLDRRHPTLELVPDDLLLDAVVFSGHPGLVTRG